MKAVYFQVAGALALTFAIAACVSGPDRPPRTVTQPRQPVAVPTRAPATTPPPIVREPVFENYLDAPQTPGTWTYLDEPAETLALYGVGENYRFIVRCDKSTRMVGLARVAENGPASPRAMEISTETTKRSLTAQPVTTARQFVAATLPPRDPLLDAMAITKGRFAVSVEGENTLYLPAWAEVTRVIEDCR